MRIPKTLTVTMLFALSVSYAATPTPHPKTLCPAVVNIGIASGEWRKSNSTPGGWVCSNMGFSTQFGSPGPLGMPSNVSYFVVGSGPSKLDNVQIKLNVNNVSSFSAGREKLVQATRSVLSVFGEKLPAGAEEKISRVKPRIDEVFNGKVTPIELFKSAFPGHTLVITQTNTRLTSVLVTIRSDTSSKLWD
jgi:uncharacterized protein DUF6030